MDKIWEDLNMYVYGVISALATGVVLLVRKVITNERQIDLLRQEITIRNETYQKANEEMKEQLSEIRTDVKQLMSGEYGVRHGNK